MLLPTNSCSYLGDREEARQESTEEHGQSSATADTTSQFVRVEQSASCTATASTADDAVCSSTQARIVGCKGAATTAATSGELSPSRGKYISARHGQRRPAILPTPSSCFRLEITQYAHQPSTWSEAIFTAASAASSRRIPNAGRYEEKCERCGWNSGGVGCEEVGLIGRSRENLQKEEE